MCHPQPFDPDRERLLAAIRVRRDVQTAAEQLVLVEPTLSEALHAVRTAQIGMAPEVLYRNLIDLVVTAERQAGALRVAHPDMSLRRAA